MLTSIATGVCLYRQVFELAPAVFHPYHPVINIFYKLSFRRNPHLRKPHTEAMSDPVAQTSAMAEANAKEQKASQKAEAKAARAAKKAEAKAERVAQREAAKAEKAHAKTLAQLAEDKLLKELTSSLNTHARSATFACGGSVGFRQPNGDTATQPRGENVDVEASLTGSTWTTAAVDDVQVRFGSSGQGLTVIFGRNVVSTTEIDQLVKACKPASFGLGGEVVLDEKYRKAGKLDKTEFATSFSPYEAGIIDIVAQLLVPQYKHDKHARSIKVRGKYRMFLYTMLTDIPPG